MYLTNLRRFPLSFVALLVLFASLPFSYIPVLQLGIVGGIHVDIAWIYGIAVFTVLTALPMLWRAKSTLYSLATWRIFTYWLLFMTLSLVWTANLTRGLITVAFAWLLFTLASVVVVYWPLIKQEKRIVLCIIAASVSFSCLFAAWQFVGDALGVAPAFTLLPQDYRIGTFSFARPTAFALEPQFFASILLAPWAFALYGTLRSKQWNYALCFGLLTIMLGLTLSRGAFVAMTFTGIILLYTTGSRIQRIKVISFGLAALLFALLALITISLFSTNNSAYTTLDTTLNQISLGVIDLPSETDTDFAERSSSSRVEMAILAVNIWSSQSTSFFVGTGVGGFGQTAHAFSNEHYPTTLVANNYYAEMLTETGVIGVALFIAFIGSILIELWRTRRWLLTAVLVAYLVQWSFFSGNANVVHIWVYLGLLGGFLLEKKNMQY
ncbi:MAG: O-antigen ligase family protein [Candidatus Saccharimonadales bacterium]